MVAGVRSGIDRNDFAAVIGIRARLAWCGDIAAGCGGSGQRHRARRSLSDIDSYICGSVAVVSCIGRSKVHMQRLVGACF